MALYQAIRGMNDILPSEMGYWHLLEKRVSQLSQRYAYQEIRMPIVESAELFQRSIGEATDIVEKEMFIFSDRHEEKRLALRPEGTAGCVRALLEHGLSYNQTQKLWYQGPLFRHERPQRGRYRQFHQVGFEAFGFASADIEAELLMLGHRLWKELQIDQFVHLELNTLGTSECRLSYRKALVDYFQSHYQQLDADSQRRLNLNPLRILDSKNPHMISLIEQAPKLSDYLSQGAKDHFEQLQAYLTAAGIQYSINPRLVRGLDYYSHTVFEWVTDQLGSQSAIAAGGRYDGLVEMLGGQPTPAAGFALGCERVIELIKLSKEPVASDQADIYFILLGQAASIQGLAIAEQLREQFPAIKIMSHCGGGQMKNQFKRADRSGAQIALILGEQELQDGTIGIKFLREQQPQLLVQLTELSLKLKDFFNC